MAILEQERPSLCELGGMCSWVDPVAHGWCGDLGQGAEGRVALESELAGKSWSWEVAHVRTTVYIVISAEQWYTNGGRD